MEINEIFDRLFTIAKQSNDPEGVVAACLVQDGEIVAESASSDDGQYHAEYLLIKKLLEDKIDMQANAILYTTLEPCSDFPDINDGNDCTTWIIKSGIKKVVYGASDPEFSTKARDRLESNKIEVIQIDDADIITKCEDLFNSTIKVDLKDMKLARDKKL